MAANFRSLNLTLQLLPQGFTRKLRKPDQVTLTPLACQGGSPQVDQGPAHPSDAAARS